MRVSTNRHCVQVRVDAGATTPMLCCDSDRGELATAGNTAPNTTLTGSALAPHELTRLATRVERAAELSARATVYCALFLVPLLITSPDAMFGYGDVPKVAAVRVLAGIIAIAWLAHAAAGSVRTGRVPAVPSPFHTARWITFSAAAFLLTAAVSSAVSVSQGSAFLGAYPGFDSTDLYSLASYVVIGATAARFMRSRRDTELALWSLALAGGLASIYAIAQFAGLDPLHFDRFEVNDGRTPLTFGNPAFAGSFLTISLFASVGLFFLRKRPVSRAGFMAFALVVLQTAALGTAASRGAWVGAGVGALVFAGIVLAGHRRTDSGMPWRHLGMLGLPVGLAMVTGLVFVAGGSGSSSAADRLQSFNGDLPGSGLNGRQATWTATIELIEERPWLQGESSNAVLRHMFGYGPDSYRYAYQLVAPDEHVDTFVPHAHNSFLNITTELGFAGLLAWTALTIAVVVTGISIARDRKAQRWTRLMSAAVTAAFVAHAVDQLANVPRAADSLAMWALIGIVVALAAVSRDRRGEQLETTAAISVPGQTDRQNTSAVALIAPAIALIAIAVVAGVTFLANAGHVMADRAAASLQSEMLRGALVSDLSKTAGRASRLASDVAYYHTLEAMALDAGSQAVTTNPPLRQSLAARALNAREAAASAIRLSPTENFSYARALSAAGLAAEGVERYELAVALSPRYWAAWLELAAAYATVGRVADGVAALSQAEKLIARQADVTRQDPLNLENFASVQSALGIRPN